MDLVKPFIGRTMENGRSYLKLGGHLSNVMVNLYQFRRLDMGHMAIYHMALLDIFGKLGSGWSASCL